MKKSLIPILSLLFIISLDSCKKDSDKQPDEEQIGDTTRVVKINYARNGTPAGFANIFEYDQSGRVTAIKDTANPSIYFTISYNGDEATMTEITPNSPNSSYVIQYKLNKDHLPVQRISAEGSNYMSATRPSYAMYRDTCKYEYDANGLLVKATGTGYDSTWNNYQAISTRAIRRAYTKVYTNNGGKLMSVKNTSLDEINDTKDGTPLKTVYQTDAAYSFEYNKNYINKADVINAWVLGELDVLYSSEFPMMKYANLPDKVAFTEKQTNLATGDVNHTSNQTSTIELEFTPSGYISTELHTVGNTSDKYRFTYNK